MAGRTAWFPGHMAKGTKELTALMEKLDAAVEVRDARAPDLTASPLASQLGEMKPLWLVLTKSDLADPATTRKWLDHFRSQGRLAWALDARAGRFDQVRKAVSAAAPAYRELRLAVFGIPNVGKSAFLNGLVGRRAAAVGGVPGVTKAVNWYKGAGCLVVDSPGILDPKADPLTQKALCWVGCSKPDVIGGWETVATDLLLFLRRGGLWNVIEKKWGVKQSEDPAFDLETVGRRLGCLAPGGSVNWELAGRRLVDAFASGSIGKFSLEAPDSPASSILEGLE
ncbi:putative GTPase [Jonquetella anthropi DSM 22815]|uniref:Ribosome biogenesis GTPase A n=1 Tax=Jonquetella anthropi DSM 22815 TaxID=885272 RepID=H0UMI8_9BACT|nr:GTPase [Jonquetella anthropi]EHM13691.1 putative GTPase [Jonquetella anthropi DSM 22815]